MTIKQVDIKAGLDVIQKDKNDINTNSVLALRPVSSSPFYIESPKDSKENQNDLNRPGTSHYEPLHYNPKEDEEKEDEDLI